MRPIPVPPERRREAKERRLKIVGAPGNNLRNVTAEIPLGTFTCVTGVSGGGKSTLIIETLYKACARRLYRRARTPGPATGSRGWSFIDKVIDIDQSPDRPHAALEPRDLYRRLHADPRLVRRPAGSEGAATRPDASPST
ncbi:MAG: hypothetical protein MPW14_06435 [Candidatus Manganitrophus sp.]|nr:MAG: hypothetical protein MPW14_06435 [Candidatus Manganitrophus sp.]